MKKLKALISFIIVSVCIAFICPAVTAKTELQKYNLTVPVVMYHKISDADNDRNNPWCISPKLLEEDFREYLSAGFTPITISEYSALSDAYKKLSSSDDKERSLYLNNFLTLISETPNPLLITFDDGYSDGYDILLPLLKKYNIRANIALVGSYSASSSDFLSEKQIKEMAESGYVEFGNHSYSLHNFSHDELKVYYSIPENGSHIIDDILKNEEFIRNATGKLSAYFAYPSGVFSEMTESILKTSGIKVSLATNISEKFPKLSDDTTLIARYNRSPDITARDFVLRLIKQVKHQSPEAYYLFCQKPEKYLTASGNTQNTNNLIQIDVAYKNETYKIYGINKNGTTYIDSNMLNFLSDEILTLLNKYNFRNWFICSMDARNAGSETYYPVRESFEKAGFRVEYDSLTKNVSVYY